MTQPQQDPMEASIAEQLGWYDCMCAEKLRLDYPKPCMRCHITKLVDNKVAATQAELADLRQVADAWKKKYEEYSTYCIALSDAHKEIDELRQVAQGLRDEIKKLKREAEEAKVIEAMGIKETLKKQVEQIVTLQEQITKLEALLKTKGYLDQVWEKNKEIADLQAKLSEARSDLKLLDEADEKVRAKLFVATEALERIKKREQDPLCYAYAKDALAQMEGTK